MKALMCRVEEGRGKKRGFKDDGIKVIGRQESSHEAMRRSDKLPTGKNESADVYRDRMESASCEILAVTCPASAASLDLS
jgi:hypothetical protein